MIEIKKPFSMLEQAASTNDVAFQLLKKQPNCLVWTTNQTAGRGSRGREWLSPKGDHLAFSLGFHAPPAPTLDRFSYPLFAGLLVVAALEREGVGANLQLKWPNDIWLNGKKLAGILCESRISGADSAVVLGIGVNLKRNPALESLPYGYAALSEDGVDLDPHAFFVTLTNLLPRMSQELADFEALQQAWLKYAWVKEGTLLNIQLPGQTYQGAFKGISLEGRLLLEHKGELLQIDQASEAMQIIGDSQGQS